MNNTRSRTRLVPGPLDTAARWTLGSSIAGLLSLIPVLPSAARALLLASFVFVAPGSALVAWARGLPRETSVALVPVLGMAIMAIATAAESLTGVWQPRVTVLALAVGACVSVILRLSRMSVSDK